MRAATRRAALMPRAAQRPRRERDPAGPARGQQARRGQPRHRDLVALAPAELRALAGEDAAEQDDVAAEGEDLEREGDAEPQRVALLDALPGVLAAPASLAQQPVEQADRDGGEDRKRTICLRVNVERGASGSSSTSLCRVSTWTSVIPRPG